MVERSSGALILDHDVWVVDGRRLCCQGDILCCSRATVGRKRLRGSSRLSLHLALKNQATGGLNWNCTNIQPSSMLTPQTT
jgi:hypothetical protein